MICLCIPIVFGLVNDFVIENKRFGKAGAGECGRAVGEVRPADAFFYFGKITLVLGRELPGQMDKHINPGCSIPVGKPGPKAVGNRD